MIRTVLLVSKLGSGNFLLILAGSIWILKWTYGSFKLFILINAIVDGIFAFILIGVFLKR
jgi:hypothetical protein